MVAQPRSSPHGDVDDVLEAWPEDPSEIAEDVIDEYGEPDEAAPSRLVWHGNGPWKRTVLYREGVPHEFPKPHTDYLEQVVDYHVPPEKADELTAFDGSIVIDRTRGEMRARCDKESMNILSLNLAHDIVTEETDVDEARKNLAITGLKDMMGASSPYLTELTFNPTGEEGDPDEAIVDEVTETDRQPGSTGPRNPEEEGDR